MRSKFFFRDASYDKIQGKRSHLISAICGRKLGRAHHTHHSPSEWKISYSLYLAPRPLGALQIGNDDNTPQKRSSVALWKFHFWFFLPKTLWKYSYFMLNLKSITITNVYTKCKKILLLVSKSGAVCYRGR